MTLNLAVYRNRSFGISTAKIEETHGDMGVLFFETRVVGLVGKSNLTDNTDLSLS
jgi:hypothetical protein